MQAADTLKLLFPKNFVAFPTRVDGRMRLVLRAAISAIILSSCDLALSITVFASFGGLNRNMKFHGVLRYEP
jgi:hypothetical protein